MFYVVTEYEYKDNVGDYRHDSRFFKNYENALKSCHKGLPREVVGKTILLTDGTVMDFQGYTLEPNWDVVDALICTFSSEGVRSSIYTKITVATMED